MYLSHSGKLEAKYQWKLKSIHLFFNHPLCGWSRASKYFPSGQLQYSTSTSQHLLQWIINGCMTINILLQLHFFPTSMNQHLRPRPNFTTEVGIVEAPVNKPPASSLTEGAAGDGWWVRQVAVSQPQIYIPLILFMLQFKSFSEAQQYSTVFLCACMWNFLIFC